MPEVDPAYLPPNSPTIDFPVSGEIEFRDTRPEDAPHLVRFAGEALGSTWDEAFVRWKYFANPAGRFYGRVAEMDGKPLGFYGNIPVRIKLGDRITTGAQAVDAMIAPEARRLGLFVKLNLETYAEMDRDSLVLDYALPNPASEAGFVKRLGWRQVGHIPRYIKILDEHRLPRSIRHAGVKGLIFRAYLTAVKVNGRLSRASTNHTSQDHPNLQIRMRSDFDERIDDLWRQAGSGFQIAVKRDQVYLNWRYVENPQDVYRIVFAERGAELAGIAVLSLRSFAADRSAAVVEWLVRPGDAEAGLALLARIEHEAASAGCAQIQCWMLPGYSFYISILKENGFHFSSRRFSPNYFGYTTPFIIRPHPKLTFDIDPLQIKNWYLTMGDHDYF